MNIEMLVRNDRVWLQVDLTTPAGVEHKTGDEYKVLGFQGSLVRLSRTTDHAKLLTIGDNVDQIAPLPVAPPVVTEMKPGDLVIKYRAHAGGAPSFRGFGEVDKVGARHIVLRDGSKWRLGNHFSIEAKRTRGIGMEGDQIALDTPEARVQLGAPRPRPVSPPAKAPPPIEPNKAQQVATALAISNAGYTVRFSTDGGAGVYLFNARDERVGGFYWSTTPGNPPLPMAKTPAKICRLLNEAWEASKPKAEPKPAEPPAAPAKPAAPDFNAIESGTRVMFWNASNSGFLDGVVIERHETPAIEGRTPPPTYDIRRTTNQVVWGVRATRLHAVLALPGAAKAEVKPVAPVPPVAKPVAAKPDNYGSRPWLRAANEKRAAAAAKKEGSK